jgi:hypothetical protein
VLSLLTGLKGALVGTIVVMEKTASDDDTENNSSLNDISKNYNWFTKCFLRYRNLGFWAQLLTLLVFSTLTVFFVGYIQRDASDGSLNLTLEWIQNFPIQFIMNVVIIFVLSLPLLFVTRRLFIAIFFGGAIAWAISAINYFKIALRNEPFYPTGSYTYRRSVRYFDED